MSYPLKGNFKKERVKKKGKEMRRKMIKMQWEIRGVESMDNWGEEKKNQSRGGCGEVPRPATGSAVRMINEN